MTHRVTDDAGRVLDLPDVPRRIVSLVPSLTELVCALGCPERLVGVTRFCTHPPEVVAGLVRVGGTKNPACDAIRSLRPDVVLANREENRREDVDWLLAAGIAVFVSIPTSVHEAARSVEQLGILLGVRQTAAELAAEIEATRAALSETIGRRPTVFCPIWRNPWMGFNRETYAHDLLWCAGGENVCGDAAERYPRVELAAIAAARPEVILLPDEPYRFRPRHLDSLDRLADTPAWRCNRVYFVDGQALSWYGPRTVEALRYFHRLIAGA